MSDALTLNAGFLGVCDDDYREKALDLPTPKLIADAESSLEKQAEYSRDLLNMFDLLEEQASSAPALCSVLRATRKLVLAWDHEICTTGAMLEIAFTRLHEAGHSATPGPGTSEAGS